MDGLQGFSYEIQTNQTKAVLFNWTQEGQTTLNRWTAPAGVDVTRDSIAAAYGAGQTEAVENAP